MPRGLYTFSTSRTTSIEIPVDTAEFAVVGPNAKGNFMWTLLFDTSWKRGDWLRPVTGWDSRPKILENGKE